MNIGKRNLKFLTIILAFIMLFLLCAAPDSISAEETEEKQLPISVKNYQKEIQIELPFWSPGDFYYDYTFPYSDEYFNSSSFIFDPQLAKASFGLELSSFRYDKKKIPNQYETYLSAAGFEDIYAFGYDKPTTKDTCSGVIAHKKIGEFTLIAAAPCGQGYKNEWGGNLEVGNEERHKGFNTAAQLFEKEINDYIEEHQIEGTKKLWLSGFSRASAISNLTAADMIESGEFADVYAYLYGVPRTTKKAVEYPGIYNVCGAYDPITCFPLETWGYERYGTDIYTPAQETDSDYLNLWLDTNRVKEEITGSTFKNNPQVNYRLHLMVEFLAELFPTSEEYVEDLQDKVMQIWTDPENMDFFAVLIEVFSKMENLDLREEQASNVFVDYLSLIASEHLNGDAGTDPNNWDSSLSLQFNYLIEHMPYTYMSWVFSNNNSAKVYDLTSDTRRIILVGDLDTKVLAAGQEIGGITHDGKMILPEEFGDLFLERDVFLQRSGGETIVALPTDEEYKIEFQANSDGYVAYYQIINRADELMADDVTLFMADLETGEYALDLKETLEAPEIKVLDGTINRLIDFPYEYSPTLMMRTEASYKDHLTIPFLLFIVVALLIFAAVLVLVSVIIGIVHAVRKRKRTRPYSNWWLIIPHLLSIAVLTVLTLFLTENFFQVGMVKSVSSCLNIGFIFILALRGLIRLLRATEEKGYKPQSKTKKILGSILTGALLVLTVLNWFFYKDSIFSFYKDEMALIYIGGVILLTILAILIFPGRKKKEKIEKISGEIQPEKKGSKSYPAFHEPP